MLLQIAPSSEDASEVSGNGNGGGGEADATVVALGTAVDAVTLQSPASQPPSGEPPQQPDQRT